MTPYLVIAIIILAPACVTLLLRIHTEEKCTQSWFKAYQGVCDQLDDSLRAHVQTELALGEARRDNAADWKQACEIQQRRSAINLLEARRWRAVAVNEMGLVSAVVHYTKQVQADTEEEGK